MAQIDLSQYGIHDVKEVIYNPSYEELFKAETDPSLTGFEKGVVTELGAVNVMTGIYTGRSPKDKFIVLDANSKDRVWWTTEEYPNDNKPVTEKTWEAVKEIAPRQVMIYTIDRETPDHDLQKATHEELDRIAERIRETGIPVSVSY